jgi:inosine-uridine nucleoside N-ribohydrolase
LLNRTQTGSAPLCKALRCLLGAIFALAAAGRLPAQAPHPSPFRRAVIVDTDAAPDDLMAIAFLLARPDVRIEAITIVNGVAHVPAGGKNVLRLLALAGHNDVPVFLGRESPLSGSEEFPDVWRRTADELPGITLPETERSPDSRSAADFLTKRLLDAAHPVEVLTLGPLTNLAEVFSHTPRAARTGRQLVVLGGAVRVSGNLGDGGIIQTKNDSAEWNMFIDPAAAKIVFSSGAQIRLVPLDATQRVPIDMALFEQFQSRAETPLAKFVAQILGTQRDLIRQGYYFAWDPLAAVALTNPLAATFRPLDIAMSDKPEESGRTVEVKRGRFNAQVAIDADSLRFRDVFMKAFGVAVGGP